MKGPESEDDSGILVRHVDEFLYYIIKSMKDDDLRWNMLDSLKVTASLVEGLFYLHIMKSPELTIPIFLRNSQKRTTNVKFENGCRAVV